ncbi:Ger(x)C family spore germination protein [Paenibacillus planticolens]|nr:Ger(x)C family spore germination protein [Paenibacillus planticolens]
MKRLLFLLLSFLLVILTACIKQQNLDEITIFIACAFDEVKNNQIEFTISTPKYKTKNPGSVTNIVLSKVGQTSADIKSLMNLQLNQPINTGKISLILFGKNLATKGLSKELDVAWRDAQASRLMYLAVVDGSAKELLQSNFSFDDEKGMFLVNLLETNVKKGIVPSQNLHEFEYSLTNKGMDPVLPLLKLKGDQVTISGLALFKDDKYVTSLNVKQMNLFKLLHNNVKQGTLEAQLEDGSHVVVTNVGSKVNYEIEKDTKNTTVKINLSINSQITESEGVIFPSQEIQRLKEIFENDITTACMDLIRLFKKEGVDPLGLGDFVRSRTRNWNEDEWRQQYRSLNVSLNVKMNLTETGIQK